MRVYNFIQSKAVLTSIWILCVVITRAQKRLVLREPRLNVVVVGDIGVPESMSEVKRRVMETIRKEHDILPFNLGINLGANVYRSHSQKNDFDTLQDVFTSSFPPRLFKFDFLSVLGRVDYDCDLATQLQYYQYDSRFHMPDRNFYYGFC
ncbi:hypothetical protein RF11_00424 [Thelohanellus kitauei]|uniref:Metallophosphoesterase 1 n=1 Tax=Thelohanellus kitauei TaxID=669202 RepID=A0A0C2IW02_THEKT|nr:hypothetical protein RF11_00424 [Thelohanellus kitauei]